MVLFVNFDKKEFFLKFVKTFENKNKPVNQDAGVILDLLEDKPSEITAWNYYGYRAVAMLQGGYGISGLNGFKRIFRKDRLKLEKEFNIE